MILDVETALVDYLTRNMLRVVGHGNAEVPIYPGFFPQECKPVAVMIAREGGSGDEDNPLVDNASVRVWARHTKPADALRLMRNLDALLHRVVNVNLDESVRLLGASRNVGPERVDSENNDLVRYYCLYDMLLISRR